MRLLLPTLALSACATGDPGPASMEAWSAEADGLTLQGTLLLPEREAAVPGVVLVHGSGPNSRDQPSSGQLNLGFGFEVPVFADLARGLRRQGIAVLRYDKRTCGPFNACGDNDYPTPASDVTVFDFADDAATAATALAQHPSIDPARVWIVGHSQGGQLTPMVVRDADAAGGVILAGPHSPTDDLITFQRDSTVALLQDAGASEAQIAEARATLDPLVDGLAALRAGTHDGSDIGGASAAFWRSWLDAGDEAPTIAAQLDVPLAAVQGDYDWNVPPRELDGWSATFADSQAPRSTSLLPCVTHALTCIAQPDYRLITAADLGDAVHRSVIDAVATAVLDTD